MPAWLTRENVLAAISILALLLSLANFAEQRVSSRRNLAVSCPCVLFDGDCAFFNVVFINKSRLPISITRICIDIDGRTHEFGQRSVRMFEYAHPERKGRMADDTTLLPVKVDSLGFSSELFYIEGLMCIESDHADLTIGTNRGEIKSRLCIGTTTDVVQSMLQRLGR